MNANIKELRQRYGLDEDDASQDEHILSLSPLERVAMLSGWHLGDPAWASLFKTWFENQGLYLTTNKNADGVL